MTRFPILCCLIGVVLLCWPTSSLALEPLQRSSVSHRVIPRTENSGSPPAWQDFTSPELLELIQEYQKLQRAQAADQQTREAEQALPEPHFSPKPLPATLSAAAGELVQQLSEGTSQSFAEDMSKDISEIAETLNRQLQDQLPEGMTVQQQELPLTHIAETDRSLQRLLEVIQQKQVDMEETYQQTMEQYKHAWPSNSVAPQEWIKKVQPFINEELARQLVEAREEISARSSNDRQLPLRTHEQTSSGLASSLFKSEAKKTGSNTMVESLMKVIDTKSTSLIKAATSRQRHRGQSWWKSLRAKSKTKVSEWNRKLTKNSTEVGRQRLSYLTSMPQAGWATSKGRTPSNDRSFLWLLAGGLVLCLLLALVVLLAFNRRLPHGVRRSDGAHGLGASAIHDRDSLLQACHHLALRLFGSSSRFWNHREMFSQLADAVETQSHSMRLLAEIYEHARYDANGKSMSAEDLQTARRLFAGIRKGTLVTHQ